MSLSKKAAYIKGLADGLALDENNKHDKILLAMLDCLDEMTDKIDELEANQQDLTEQVDAIDLDLAEIEDELYEDYGDEDDFVGEFYEITCKECGDKLNIHEDALAIESLACPNCGTEHEIDLSEIIEEVPEE